MAGRNNKSLRSSLYTFALVNTLRINTPGVVESNKAVIVDTNKDLSGIRNLSVQNLNVGGSLLTASASELNYVDTTPGIGEEFKTLVLDGNLNISNINSLSANYLTGTIQTASQPNITSLGTLSNLNIQGGLNIIGHNGSTTGLRLNNTLITATASELNKLDGLTSNTAELNVLTGITATVTQLNYTNTTKGTAEAEKALIFDINKDITNIRNLTATNLTGTILTASQPNITSVGTLNNLTINGNVNIATHNGLTSGLQLNGTLIMSSATEINYLKNINPGTVIGNKALAVDNNKDLLGFRNISLSGNLSTTQITLNGLLIQSSADEINNLYNITKGTASNNKAVILDTNKDFSGIRNLTIDNLILNGSNLQLPSGNTATRPISPSLGFIRYNTETSQFEGYGAGNSWGSLGGVTNVQQTTKILSENSPGSNDNNLRFINNNSETMRITSTGNVGINNNNPSYKLDITGTLNCTSTSNFRDLMTIYKLGSNNNSVVSGLTLKNSYSSASSSGLGIGIDFWMPDSSGGQSYSGSLNCVVTNPVTSNFANKFEFKLYNAGIINTAASIDSTGLLTITSLSTSTISASSNVNISNHNGTDTGLQLNGTLVTASASELNYNDITTTGTAEASKALILNSSRNITNINNISVNNLALNNTINYRTLIDCGSTANDRILGLYNNITTFYGFGANDGLLKIQGGHSNGIAFYTSASNTSTGTEQMRISSSTTNILNTLALNGTSITASANDINTLTSVSAGNVSANKALIVDSNKDLSGIRNLSITGDLSVSGNSTLSSNLLVTGSTSLNNTLSVTGNSTLANLSITGLTLNGTIITSSAADINKLANVTSTSTQLNYTNTTAGTAEATKALIVDSNRDINNINSFTCNTLTANTLTANNNVNINNLTIGGNKTLASWGLVGPQFNITSNTFTDSSTVANSTSFSTMAINSFQKSTLAASNSNITYSSTVANVYIANGPDSGTNATINRKCALLTGGAIAINPGILNESNWSSPYIHFNSGANTTVINDTGSSNIFGTIGTNQFNAVEYRSNTVGRTMSRAATIHIINQPSAGTNMTITNQHALYIAAGNTTLADSSVSTNTTSGALVVTGGVGIGGNINIGGTLSVTGNSTITGTFTVNNNVSLGNSSAANSIISFTSANSAMRFYTHSDGICYIQTGTSVTTGSAADLFIGNYNRQVNDSTRKFMIKADGKVGINTITPGYNLDVLGSINSTSLYINGTSITASAAEINYNDITTIGTAEASKALVVDINKDIQSIRRLHLNNLSVGTLDYTNLDRLISAIDNTLTTGNAKYLCLGKNFANFNEAEWGYVHTGDGLMSNRQEFGFYGANGIFVITAARRIGINKTNPGYELDVTGDINLTGSLRFGGTALTASVTKLNYNDIVTIGTAEASKALILDSSRNIININSLTAADLTGTLQTASQPNITSLGALTSLSTNNITLNGTLITATATEINYNDITTAGTAEASKTVVLDSNKNISGINNITLTGINDVITLTNNTTSAKVNLKFINDTQSWELGSRGSTAINNPNSFYLYDNISSLYRLIVNSSGSLNIVNHNGSSTGLQLNGILVTATAAKLNYNDIVTIGTAEASKALILDSSRNISNINSLTASNLTGTLLTSSQANITTVGTLTGLTSSGAVSITNNTSSTTPSTGSLIVTGGIGSSGNLNIGQIINCGITNTTYSTIGTAGAYLRVGNGTITDSGTAANSTVTNAVFSSFYRPTLAATNNSVTTTNASTVYIENAPLAGSNMTITNSYALLVNSGKVLINDTTNSTSSSTGALIISGGVGINGSVNIGASLTVLGNINGTIATSSQPNITSIGTLTSLSTGNITLNGTLISATATDINKLSGATFSSSDLNKLANITSTATELNYVDLTTSPGSAEASKAIILDSAKSIKGITKLQIGTNNATLPNADFAILNSSANARFRVGSNESSGDCLTFQWTYVGANNSNNRFGIDFFGMSNQFCMLNSGNVGISTGTPGYRLDVNGSFNCTSFNINGTSVTSTATELNYVDLTTGPGTAEANKALVLDSNKDIISIRNLTVSNLTGTILTASQPNITSVGTLTSLSTNSLTLNGTVINSTASEINTLSSVIAGTVSAGKALIVDSNKDLTGLRNLTISGDLTISGTTTTINSTQINIKDNILQLNSGPVGTYDSGLIIQRYQTSNDTNIGDIVNETAKENYTASSVTINTIVLPSNANSNNNYYNGWWIKIQSATTGSNQVRQVSSYNGSTKTITLSSNFTTLPTGTISVNLYNKAFSNLIWQESNKRFITSYTAQDVSAGILTILDYADLATNNLNILSTTDSTNSTTGGSLTISGGASIAKKLFIGTDLSIGGTLTINNTLVTATATELNYNDIVTIGIAEASKALILDSSRNISNINSLTATNLTGTLLTSSQTSITTVGTLTGLTSSGQVSITNNTASTNATTGALIVTGGIGSNGNINSGQIIKSGINNTSYTTIGTSGAYFQTGNSIITNSGAALNSTIATAVFSSFARPTLAATNTGVTTTNAATIYIENEPLNGNNMTLSNSYALWVNSGKVLLGSGFGSTNKSIATLTINADTLNTNTEGGAHGLLISGGNTIANTCLYMGADNTNGVGYIQSSKIGAHMPIAINHRGGNVGIGLINPGHKLDVSGDINVSGNYRSAGSIVSFAAISGVSDGTATANKALILDLSKNISGINNLSSTSICLGTQTTNLSTRFISALDSAQATTTIKYITFGQSNSDRNCVDLGFLYNGVSDNTNAFSIGFATAGRRLVIQAGGNVGIGNTSPGYRLDVSGDINLTGSLRFGGTALTSNVTELNYLDLTTGPGTAEASKALVLDSNKDITGINSLGLTGYTTITGTNAIFRTLPFSDSVVYLQAGLTATSDSAADIFIGNFSVSASASTRKIMIKSDGKVGIGLISPSYALDVSGDINLSGNYRSGGSIVSFSSISGVTNGTGAANKALILNTDRDISNIQNMSLTGTLTVGTTGSGPNRINFAGTSGDGTSNHTVLAERIYNSTEQSELLIFKGNDAASTAGPDRIRYRSAEHRFQTYTSAEDYSTPVGDNNDRMFIGNDGKVGINTTSPSYQLDVNGTFSHVPPGTVIMYIAATAPAGFLLCNGSEISRTTYATLFAIISTTYGSGNGSTTFNLPDLRGRVPIGFGQGSGLTNRSLNGKGGAETHTLTTSEMPSHNHSISDPGHGHSAGDNGHSHNITRGTTGYTASYNSSRENVTGGSRNNGDVNFGSDTGYANVYVNNNTTGISVNNNGSGNSHNNMQPFIVMNFIIKF
jgi:microcystin-dependent protein